MEKIFFGLLITVFICGSGCALQKDIIYVDDRVDAIEKKLSMQNSASGDAAKGLRTQYARLNNRIDDLEELIRRIEGRFEEIDFALTGQKEDLVKLKKGADAIGNTVSSMEVRLNNLASYVGYDTADSGKKKEPTVATGDATPKTVEKPAEQLVRSDDERLYDKGRAAYDKGNLKAAEKYFRELLHKFPGSDQADNAQFWIGECYYRVKKYKKAILEYQNVIENYPKGNKIAGAYLKQGLAFLALGEPENSKFLLKDLIKQYPNSGEAKIARKKMETFKN